MVVLGIDPGAVRGGWCVIKKADTGELTRMGSGILGLERGGNKSKEKYQEYRLRLIGYWCKEFPPMLDYYKPDLVVSEIVPVVGGGNFVAATQSQLAGTVATVSLAIAVLKEIPIEQLSANTVKKRIGKVKDASKVQVREGVYKLMPETKGNKEWTKVFDEVDAHAISLTALGCRNV